MFRQIRFQTGEIKEVINEMENGNVPCVDVDDIDELDWVIKKLAEYGIHQVTSVPYDKNARDRIKEPEFEFRIAFSKQNDPSLENYMYIDFYFEPVAEKTYDEIFGD